MLHPHDAAHAASTEEWRLCDEIAGHHAFVHVAHRLTPLALSGDSHIGVEGKTRIISDRASPDLHLLVAVTYRRDTERTRRVVPCVGHLLAAGYKLGTPCEVGLLNAASCGVSLTVDFRDDAQRGELAARLAASVGEVARQDLDGRVLLGVTIGIATNPDTVDSVEGMLDAADAAMYEAKRAGLSSHAFARRSRQSNDFRLHR